MPKVLVLKAPRRHVQKKVLVLKAPRRHVQILQKKCLFERILDVMYRNNFWRFWPKFGRKRPTSRDGCVLRLHRDVMGAWCAQHVWISRWLFCRLAKGIAPQLSILQCYLRYMAIGETNPAATPPPQASKTGEQLGVT